MSDAVTRAKALLEKITPGPWGADKRATAFGSVAIYDAHNNDIGFMEMSYESGRNVYTDLPGVENAAFVAAAPTLVADLIAEVERMREALLPFVPYPDKMPTPKPQRHHYDYHDDWLYREDRETWVNEQNARKGLGLPYIETGGE